MNKAVADYMIWVIEIVARRYFSGDKGEAYCALVDSGIWDCYVDNYDVTHSLGSQYILAEIGERFKELEIKTC
jgi:hypothetical protein